jgi:hypothetical protein
LIGDRDIVWEQLCNWEKEKIREYKTLHYPGQIGCNFTLGGDGVLGVKRIKSLEERQKISESKKKLYTDLFARKKLGEAIHQAKLDPVKYQNHCDGQKKRYEDPNERIRAHECNTQRKRVQQLTLEGEVIAEFPSISYAVAQTKVLNIKLCCCGKRKFAGGFRWRYAI